MNQQQVSNKNVSDASVNLHDLQRKTEDLMKESQSVTRSVVRTYVGLWGMAGDSMKSAWNAAMHFANRAEKRGLKVQQDLDKQAETLSNRASGELKEWRGRMRHSKESVAKEIDAGEKVAEEEIEKQIEKVLMRLGIPTRDRLDKLSREIEELSAKIDQELLRHDQPLVEPPFPDYDEMNVETVSAQFDALDDIKLMEVRSYEATHRNRVTILREVDRLLEERAAQSIAADAVAV